MSGTSPSAGAGPGGQHDGSSLGDRLRRRREQLGLSLPQVAHRAGMSPGYLEYLEEQPVGTSREGMFRLAGALESTVSELQGEDVGRPPGAGWAAARPELLRLDPEECRARLGARGVGRVVVTTPEGPAAVPVNYTVDRDAVAFRTVPGTTPARAAGAEVAFEVDHLDEALSEGWSVLVVGHGVQVTDPAAVRRLAERAGTPPWVGSKGTMWIRIGLERVTGRRIRTGGPPPG
ncbi:helix-turn-helix domain-containing protein [Peterkaempfera bronchialis]|uniref:DNA-binding protein n=1 Tax=Peterkaempfera bronchialis TaxID=2126346 RepID=A0A345SS50_9ACTN|nr:pyridoxamine 5'-phosphate oxidase family protein [Peterkaempfera bronchialis]AXI76555.1 DNA-binding protein [Peterkaempfera bronchialis]